MSKRFDLEQQILNCWNITSDLGILLENIIENDNFDRDDISNVVLGLETLYQLKFDKCFRTLEEVFKEYADMKRELDAAYQQIAQKDLELDRRAEEFEILFASSPPKPKARKRTKTNA